MDPLGDADPSLPLKLERRAKAKLCQLYRMQPTDQAYFHSFLKHSEDFPVRQDLLSSVPKGPKAQMKNGKEGWHG